MVSLSELDVSEVTGAVQYDKYVAVRTMQGGRTVYTIQVPLVHIPSMLPIPDPDRRTLVNRRVNLQHARKFGRYVRDKPDWIAPPLLVRDEGKCRFEEQQSLPGGMALGFLYVPRTSRTAIKIIDGQHRILGIALELQEIERALERTKDEILRAKNPRQGVPKLKERLAQVEADYSRFHAEHLSLEIYVEQEPIGYEQMFYDVAENALGINQAIKVRFDSRRVANRALSEVSNHALLKDRVDDEQDRITGRNPNLLGAKHVVDLVRSASVGVTGRIGKRREAELEESTLVETANDYLDCLLQGFADPLEDLVEGRIDTPQLRANSVLGSVTMLRVLAGVYYELTELEWSRDDIADFFARLSPHMSAPIPRDSLWMKTGDFATSAYGPFARSQNLKHLTQEIVGWAISPPRDL